MQWRKLFERDPRLIEFCDKMALRRYVDRMGLDARMASVHWYGHDADAIPFDRLPAWFVLKPAHLSGQFKLCDDKSRLDVDAARQSAGRWLRRTHGQAAKQWAYKHAKPGVLVEEYLRSPPGHVVPPEYRVYCFDGEPEATSLSWGKLTGNGQFAVYTPDWRRLPWCLVHKGRRHPPSGPLDKPVFLDQMLDIARQISRGFGHLRVDFFDVAGRLYLAEVTPYTGSGYLEFIPCGDSACGRSIDDSWGDLWPIAQRSLTCEFATALFR